MSSYYSSLKCLCKAWNVCSHVFVCIDVAFFHEFSIFIWDFSNISWFYYYSLFPQANLYFFFNFCSCLFWFVFWMLYLCLRGRRRRDHMIFRSITAYHHYRISIKVRCATLCDIVCHELWTGRWLSSFPLFSPPIKLTTTI